MPIRQFEPSRAIEVIAPRYGSGYRLGGGLVITAAHLLDGVGSDCEVRDKRSFGKEKAHVVWKAQGSDLALIELPEGVAGVDAIALGQLPEATAGEKLAFQMYAYPRWARTQREQGSAAGGRQIEGIIYLSDRSPDGLLVLESERLPPEGTAAGSEWAGASGSAIVCDGLVIAVQSQHQNPNRPASLEATPLGTVYDDGQWRQLLEKHGICLEPEIVHLQIAKNPLEISWREASAQLLEEWLQLTTNPMTRREDFAYEVQQVFVPLGLVERKKVPRRKKDVSPEKGSELYQEGEGIEQPRQSLQNLESQENKEQERQGSQGLKSNMVLDEVEVTKRFNNEQFLVQVLQQGQSPKSQGNRIAIIGEPGAGKTTLLQRIASWILEKFSASIVIWVSLADLQGDSLENYLEHRWLRRVIREAGGVEPSKAIKRDFGEQFRQGRVWLLLDGLDEMQVTSNPLSEIQRQIREGGWLQQSRILLTCRVNLWDGNRNALDTFDVYRTLEFVEPGQVELFIEKWFAPQGEDAIQKGQALNKALQEPDKGRIRDLVKNPLRLTLLCFDWYLKGGRLPETQAELYQRFVERIYEWKAEEFPTTEEQRQALNRALAQLSLAAIDDQDEQGNARFRLRHRLVQKHLSEKLLSLALQLGWLNDIGVDSEDPSEVVYAFYHTTFEEYFAALAIGDWDFFLPYNHRNKPVKDKSYRIFAPQWRQVFLLWLGRQDKGLESQKEALIQSLLRFRDGCRGFYSDRAFLLAAAGIVEFKDYTQADEVIDQLVQWRFETSNPIKIFWAELTGLARSKVIRREWAETALSSIAPQRTIRTLVWVIETTANEYTRRRAIESLDNIGTGNEIAIRALAQVLENTANEYTCQSAIESLGTIGTGNETAIRALVQVLENTANEYTRRSTIKSLRTIGTGNETEIRALVQVLENTANEYTRRSAIESLGTIGTGDETVIHTLVRVLENTADEYTRRRVIESLDTSDTGHEAAILTLTEVIESTGDEYTRRSAIESLSTIGAGHGNAIRALGQVIEGTTDEYTLRKAIQGLGAIGTSNDTAIRTLVRVIEITADGATCWDAANSLATIGMGHETTIRELVRVIETTTDDAIRRKAANRLLSISTGHKDSILELLWLIETAPDDVICWKEANRLSTIDIDHETIIRELVRVIETTADRLICWRAAYKLGTIGSGHETAIRELVRVIETTPNDAARQLAIESLNSIGSGHETAIRELVRVIETTPDDSIYQLASRSLCIIGSGHETAIRELVRVIETTPNVYAKRCRAIQSLGTIGTGHEIAILALAQVIESAGDKYTRRLAVESLSAIGIGHEIAIRELFRIIETTADEFIHRLIVEVIGIIGTNHEIALRESVRILETTADKYTYRRVIEILGIIGTDHETAINALVRVIKSTEDEYARWSAIKNLSIIGTRHEIAIHALVQAMETTKDDATLRRIAESLSMIGVSTDEVTIRAIVRVLCRNFRTEEAYRLMVQGAGILSYPEFYQIFHASM
ncbi:MAG: HEAT repeat domain-containing protein [Nodosilinea sp.]